MSINVRSMSKWIREVRRGQEYVGELTLRQMVAQKQAKITFK